MCCLRRSEASGGRSGFDPRPGSGFHCPTHYSFFHRLSRIKGRRKNRGLIMWWNRGVKLKYKMQYKNKVLVNFVFVHTMHTYKCQQSVCFVRVHCVTTPQVAYSLCQVFPHKPTIKNLHWLPTIYRAQLKLDY